MTTAEKLSLRFEDRIYELTGSSEDRSVFGALQSQQGFWEPHVVSVLKDCIDPEFVCLDIGANIGAHSVVMADLACNGQVIAFEASRRNFEFLHHNLKNNGYTTQPQKILLFGKVTAQSNFAISTN